MILFSMFYESVKVLRYIMIRKETEKESKEASKQEKQLLYNR